MVPPTRTPGEHGGMGRIALVVTVAVAIAIGLWLRWPAMDGGFRGDDYVQVSALRGRFAVPRAPWDLFRFDGRDATEQAALRAQGYHPWWADPELRLSMFRPLSSLLLALDYQLFGVSPRGYHLHGMLWWVLLVAAASFCLSQLLPRPAVAIAAVLFAFDECHEVPIAWIANRSTLVAGTFALLAVGLHLRGSRGDRPRAAQLARFAPVPALLAGEYSLPVLAYILAHTLLSPGLGGPRARAARVLPVGLWGSAYLLLRHATHHGIAGSGYYMSPLHEPLSYLQAALWRIPALLANALFGMPVRPQGLSHLVRVELLGWLGPEHYTRLPGWGGVRLGVGVAACALLVAWVVRGRRATTDMPRARHGWLACGVLLSCVPAAGSIAEERLVLGAAFGVSALLAGLLWETIRAGRRAIAIPLGLGLLLMHVVLPGLSARSHAAGFAQRSRTLTRYCLDAELPVSGAAEVGAYLIAPADFTTAANLVYARDVHGLPQPAFYRRLSGAAHAHDLRRTSPNTLEMTVLSSSTAGAFAGSLYRASDRPILTGDRFTLPGLEVEVLGARRGQPWKLRFTFDRSLDDPRLLLLHQGRQGLRRVQAPAVGETLRLPRPLSTP